MNSPQQLEFCKPKLVDKILNFLNSRQRKFKKSVTGEAESSPTSDPRAKNKPKKKGLAVGNNTAVGHKIFAKSEFESTFQVKSQGQTYGQRKF